MSDPRTEDPLDFYSHPYALTSAGHHAALLAGLPSDVDALARIIQGLIVYDVVAADLYRVDLPPDRLGDVHLRRVEDVVDRILTVDDQPLEVPRPPERRIGGRCRHYALLLVAMLRVHGTPARARCGFGAYFDPPWFEDHWVCEYWNAAERRWILVDAQLDAVWREKLALAFDPLDVPRDQFLVAGDAWDRCRDGTADPARFGISFESLRGLWFVAGDLVRDVAALNRMELLPWDVWGGQPEPDRDLTGEQLAYFDRLAGLTHDPDASFGELRALYDSDERLTVPDRVFNNLLRRCEPAT